MKKNIYLQALVLAGLALAIFILDISVPLGVAMGVLYISVVFLAAQFAREILIRLSAFATSSLVILAYFLTPHAENLAFVLANRSLSLGVIWITAWLSIHGLRATRRADARDKRIRAVFENSADGMVVINRKGIIESFNPSAEKLFAYSQKEVMGKNVKMLMPEPFQSEHDGYLQNYLTTKEKKVIGRRREVKGRRKDGSVFPMQLTVVEVMLGPRTLFIGTTRDITEQKRVELALHEAKEIAENANAAKSKFLANMSHELRTPLNAIIGYSEMLTEEIEDQQQLDDLGKIRGAGRHLLGLINDILDLSKVEAGKIELSPESFSVKSLLDEIVATLTPAMNSNGNLLTVQCDPGIGHIYSDQLRIRQILFNVLSNAAKFTHEGQVTLTATPDRDDRGRDNLEFTVTDTGIGMDEEQLSRLFKPFSQGTKDKSRTYEGTGLGLAISKRFCNLLGGDITVASKPNEGTTFIVQLPTQLPTAKKLVKVDDEIESDSAPTLENVKQDEPATSKPVLRSEKTVLIIDDDSRARELLAHHLQCDGWRVVTASDGISGLVLAQSLHPTAITLDVVMPTMSGWDVLEKLKSNAKTTDIPVVMCTIADEKMRGLALGVADYLLKPISPKKLKEVMNRHLHVASGHVLVVDDDASARELLTRHIADGEIRVSEAADGVECLSKLELDPPNLILLDLMMPELDGFGVIEEMQKNDHWRGIPVIVITSKTLTRTDREWLDSRVINILEKGEYDTDALLTRIRDRLNQLE